MKLANSALRLFIQSSSVIFFCANMGSAQAGLFDDEEARRAILDARSRIDANQKNNVAVQKNLTQQIDELDQKVQVLTQQSGKGVIELANQLEQLKQEVARLRGQNEVLANEIANEQKRQKDFYTDLDTRLRKLEPQKIAVDGREALVDQNEQRSYDAALTLFKASNFKEASNNFADFTKRYPQSAYAASAWYWLGNSYYALRDFPASIAAQQVVVSNFSSSNKASDAMLNMATSQVELKDKKAAKKTLETLISKYPDSEAAQLAKERLLGLK